MTRLADADARELACREFVRPVAIEAGAGTGKTRTLVARIGTWLLGTGWETAATELAEERAARGAAAPGVAEIAARACEGVVAITFTDAAAAEMASRVDRLLAQTARGGRVDDLDGAPAGVAADELRARAGALLAAASRLRLSTIHGFCHRLLAEWPIEAGLHPSFEVDADGERTGELATAVLLARLRAGDAALVELLADGFAPPEALDALVTLAAEGVDPRELELERFGEATLKPLFAALGAAIDEVRERAAPLRATRRAKSIPVALAALDRLRSALDEVAPDADGLTAIGPLLTATTDEASKILGDWAKGELGATERDTLGPEVTGLVDAAAELARRHGALAGLDPGAWSTAARALAGPLTEVLARRRAAGIVSFDDLLARAVRLLGERGGLRDRVRRGIRQLLVDEFQDTDRRQCDLLRRLVLDDSEAPRPGLFLVGDPKQSIYGWRSADLGAYDDFLEELRNAGGVTARLEVNFRSAPPVLAEVERLLRPRLVEKRGLQAAFQPLTASPRRADSAGFVAAGRAPVEFWDSRSRAALAEGRATRAGEASAIEAEAFAREVRELVGAGAAAYRDFALLLRTRGDLESYLDALRHAGVPYVVQKDRSYYRRREIIDTVSALRVLLDPADLLALVAFLRSPFVGVPDAAWLPLWRAGFPAAMVTLEGERGRAEALAAVRAAAAEREPAAPPLAAAWGDSLAAAVVAIAELRAERRTLPASEWVERLRCRLLLEPVAAARFLGRFGLANLERLLADVERRLAEEPDPGRALAALGAALADERPAEEARPPDLDDDAVRVMTIHTAKGLEFPHVVVAQAHKQPVGPREVPAAEIGPPGAPRELRLFGRATPGWHEAAAHRRRVAEAETARLLYVATTRAIDRLVVCGLRDTAGNRRRSDAAPSFVELLAHRFAAAPETGLEAPRADDEHGAVWRLADDGGTTSPAADLEPPPAAAPAAASGELAHRRILARSRASRPRFRSASSLAVPAELLHAERAGVDRDNLAREPGPSAAGDPASLMARARGVALHRALELVELATSDLDTWRERVRAAFLAEFPDAGAREIAGVEAAAEALTGSLLWKQLLLLHSGHDVLAHELPLVVRADGDAPERPIDGYVGTLDLLYRDGETGLPVVADFKTDALEASGIAAKVEQYRPQLELYGRAVREGLGGDRPPRLELWLLALDRVVVLPPAGADVESE